MSTTTTNQMNLFVTRENKPSPYAGIAIVSLMILTGLTFASTAVALILMIFLPVFIALSPILVPVVITTSLLATGFLASGTLGASAIALLLWLYKKEEHAEYTLHEPEVRFEKASKLAKRYKPQKEAKPPERHKQQADKSKPQGSDQSPQGEKLAEEGKPWEQDKLAEEDKPAKENKQRARDQSPEGDKLEEVAKLLGEVKQAEERNLISEVPKVLLEEQNPIGHKSCNRSTSTKRSHQIRVPKDLSTKNVGSIFMKEYQKVPRVGALAYKYFTSRDKNYTNHIHI